ncbi:hypothetical protein EYC80_007102 [Monilinia laxa]|uniref:Uncharacterized protein n=1 Tax=Monilinia laxa TaxID=61186 RepID=A0A5N6K052_MONLA|nr:hypothetical protein EYC80_007102 [Monilinia laxa]
MEDPRYLGTDLQPLSQPESYNLGYLHHKSCAKSLYQPPSRHRWLRSHHVIYKIRLYIDSTCEISTPLKPNGVKLSSFFISFPQEHRMTSPTIFKRLAKNRCNIRRAHKQMREQQLKILTIEEDL